MKQYNLGLGRMATATLGVFVSVCMFFSCASKRPGLVDLGTQEFAKVIQESGVQIIDVRTAEEFATGSIPGAMNIDVKSAYFDTEAKAKLDKSKPIALYCRSGMRSKMAGERLRALGFKGKVYNLLGGYMAWSKQ